MSDKKIQIINAAMQCFAHKGFHATTIQEIADKAGIAKGSLYFYFESKEALLMSSFHYYHEQMVSSILVYVNDRSLSPREKLSLQVEERFRQVLSQRDFIAMLMNEQNMPINEELKAFIFMLKGEVLYRFHSGLADIYGEAGRPYALDGASLLNAMFHEYISCIIWDGKELDPRELTVFMMHRMDDVMNGMMARAGKPILTESLMADLLRAGKQVGDEDDVPLSVKEIAKLHEFLEKSDLAGKEKESLLSSMLLLENELRKPEPEVIIVRGMIAFLRGFKVNGFRKVLSSIEAMVVKE
ncbi:hypothetical protein SY83_10275 [Paenibacillus swuensis]|uniref:HTH tetR-type domain-containing protein n=1 Tax=Paenibacillus swuensis TaxID=1178515 RepID=A0A172THR1_9BACL|nr:TetR/AcrR family transcriptional regulator [Paenibacillus swuensis]ANE46595.1 hypothetical protein SY83_10275 [Paenibacillus swuensis]